MDCDKKYIHELLVQLKQGFQQGNYWAIDPLMICLSEQFYLRAVSRYQLSHEDAQDAIQQTFFSLIDGGIKRYDEAKGGGVGWMWRVFYSKVVDIIRKNQRQRGRQVSLDEALEKAQEDILALEVSGEINPVQSSAEDNEIKKALQKALDALSDDEREATRRGKGTGGGRKEYRVAFERLCALFEEYYGPIQES